MLYLKIKESDKEILKNLKENEELQKKSLPVQAFLRLEKSDFL